MSCGAACLPGLLGCAVGLGKKPETPKLRSKPSLFQHRDLTSSKTTYVEAQLEPRAIESQTGGKTWEHTYENERRHRVSHQGGSGGGAIESQTGGSTWERTDENERRHRVSYQGDSGGGEARAVL